MSETNNEKGKIFDSVFKTMCQKTPKLLIPVINEIFKTNYKEEELVTLANDEHIKLNLKPIDTDSCIKLRDKYYHIECQSNPDGEMVIRMLEYDFFIALEKNRQLKDKDVIEFPQSAAIYLRNTSRTPNHLNITVRFADGFEYPYKVPVAKVKEYSLQKILEKKLMFFVPYYIMRYENSSREIYLKPEEKKQLHEEYHKILEAVNTLSSYEQGELMRLIETVLDNYESLDKDVKEDVISMGGTILEFDHDKIYQEGISIGEVRGETRGQKIGEKIGEGRGETKGMFKAVYTLEVKGYNEETACDMIDVNLEDYKKFKAENRLQLKQMEMELNLQGPKR